MKHKKLIKCSARGRFCEFPFLVGRAPDSYAIYLKKGLFPHPTPQLQIGRPFWVSVPRELKPTAKKYVFSTTVTSLYTFCVLSYFILFGIFSISPTEVKVILFIQFLVMITQGYFSKIHTVMCVMGRHLEMTLKADVISLGDDDSRCLIARRPFGITVKV